MNRTIKAPTSRDVPIWLGVLAVLLLTFVVYLPALKAGFIWDDDSMLTGNVFVKAKDGLRYIWLSTNLPDYFPLTSTSFWLEWKLWGNNPLGYHVTNILLHALSGILLWRVLRSLKIPGAFLAAILFAVHPVNVESVAWITERKNTLSLFFYLLALLFFVKSAVDEESTKISRSGSNAKTATPRRFYFLSLATFLLSLLSKTSGVMLPFILLVCVWWLNKKITRRDVVRVLPFFALALSLGLVTVWFQYHRAIGDDLMQSRTISEQIIIAGRAVWFYLGKIVWPQQLSFVYPMWTIRAHSVLSYLPAIGLLALLLWSGRSPAKWARAVFFALLCFVLMLAPVLGFLKIYFQRYSLVADHWQYFGMIAIVALAAAALSSLGKSGGGKIVYALTASAAVLALSLLTWKQCHIYQNAEALWRDTLIKNPKSWLAHNDWGMILDREGKSKDAVAHYQESLATQPEQIEAYNNLGAVYLAQGDLDGAMKLFQDALRRGPKSAVTHYNIGNVLDRQGKSADAYAEYNEALRLDPFYVDAHNNLACMFAMQGKVSEAIERFKRVLELQPDYVNALGNLGSTLVEQGKTEEAVPYLRRAIELQPNFADAHYNLGNALVALNKSDEAIGEYTAALKANPQTPLAHYKLGNIYFAQRKGNEAADEYVAALRMQPNLAEAHYQLSILLQLAHRMGDAVDHLKAAVQLKPDWLQALNNLAWIHATDTSALYRDGDEAIRLATHAAELTQHKDAAVLDTLAAAYAQNREFNQAIPTAQTALGLAQSSKDTNLVAQLEERLKMYESGRPYRDTSK